MFRIKIRNENQILVKRNILQEAPWYQQGQFDLLGSQFLRAGVDWNFVVVFWRNSNILYFANFSLQAQVLKSGTRRLYKEETNSLEHLCAWERRVTILTMTLVNPSISARSMFVSHSLGGKHSNIPKLCFRDQSHN